MFYLGTSRPHLVATRPHLGATQSHLGTRRPQVRLRRPPLGLKFNVLHAIAPTEGSDAHADVLPLIANEVEVEGKLIFAV